MATISFSASRGTVTIREQRLIESSVWSNKYSIPVLMGSWCSWK